MSKAIFRVITHSDADDVKLFERLNYIRNPIATRNTVIYANYVSSLHPYSEMKFVKECHKSPLNITTNGKWFLEYVVSLPGEESQNIFNFNDCAKEILTYLANYNGNYQAIGCVHVNTDNLHLHIIVNNIDFMTGSRFQLTKQNLYMIREEISKILNKYGFSGIKEGL